MTASPTFTPSSSSVIQMSRPANCRSTWLGVVLLVAVCGTAQSVAAQDPLIRIREPREWQEGRPVVAPAGSPVRIRGVAFHPGGVRQILVNGAPATLEADGDLWNFEQTITAETQQRTVTIAIVPTTGQRFETRFTVAPLGGSSRPIVDSTRTVTRGANSSGFKKRGWAYGAGAIAGGVLAAMTTSSTAEICQTTNGLQDCFNRTTTKASYRAVGLGIAGASLAAGVLDYTLSSRSRRVASAGDAPAAVHISAAPGNGDGRLMLGLVRVRF